MRNVSVTNTTPLLNLFFKTNLNEELFFEVPLLVGIYHSWLFRSTLEISKKLILIDNIHNETELLEAISILKKHYKSELIPKRNKEILELFNSS